MVKLKLKEGVNLPQYATPGSSGVDVVAVDILKAYKGDTEVEPDKLQKMKEGFKRSGYIKIRAFERVLFDTGIQLADCPQGLELQVRSRSGLTLKKGLVVGNQPGTIDSDYRGTIGIILYNSTPFLAQVDLNERIAQLVVCPVISSETPNLITEAIEVTDTQRGKGGYGHTGSK